MGRFKETQPEALAMVSKHAKEGKTIIITGETGTYKTTLLKELLGAVIDKNVIIIARTPEEFEGCNSDNLMIWNEKRYGSSGETSKVAAKYNPDIVGHDDLRVDGMPEAINLWLTGHFGLTTMTGGTAESCLKRISTIAASLHDNLIEKGIQYTVEAVDVVVEMKSIGNSPRIAGVYEVNKDVKEDIVLTQVYDKESYLNRPVGESREGVFNSLMEAALKGENNLTVRGGDVHHKQPDGEGSGKGVMLDAIVQGIEDAKDSPFGENRELNVTEVVDDGKGGLDFKTSKLK